MSMPYQALDNLSALMGQRTHNARFHLWPYRAKDDLSALEKMDLKVYYQKKAENFISPLACKIEKKPIICSRLHLKNWILKFITSLKAEIFLVINF